MDRTDALRSQQEIAQWRPGKPVGAQHDLDLEHPTVGQQFRVPPTPRRDQPYHLPMDTPLPTVYDGGWRSESGEAGQGVVRHAVEHRPEHRQCLITAKLEDDVVEDHLPMKQRGGGRQVGVLGGDHLTESAMASLPEDVGQPAQARDSERRARSVHVSEARATETEDEFNVPGRTVIRIKWRHHPLLGRVSPPRVRGREWLSISPRAHQPCGLRSDTSVRRSTRQHEMTRSQRRGVGRVTSGSR